MSTVKQLQQQEPAVWLLSKSKGIFQVSACSAFLFCASSSLEALNLPQGPWLPPVYSIRATVDEQFYPNRHINCDNGDDDKKKVPATAITYLRLRASPAENVDVRLEGSFGHLKNHGWKGRSVALESEWELTNDLVSNYFASSLALRLETGIGRASHRPAFELFASQFALLRYSLGKHFMIGRTPVNNDSYSQWWLSANLGIPVQGKLFAGLEACVKRVFNDRHTAFAALEYYQGFGNEHAAERMLSQKRFTMFDGLLSYRYSLAGMGSLTTTLRHRFCERYAPNLPLGIELRVDIPLSL